MRRRIITATAVIALFVGAAVVLISSTANAGCRMEPSPNGKGWTWVCR